MFPNGIQIFIGLEQSDGTGYEPVGSFITGTPQYLAALENARQRAQELNEEYYGEAEWYAYVSDEFGRRFIL